MLGEREPLGTLKKAESGASQTPNREHGDMLLMKEIWLGKPQAQQGAVAEWHK